MSQRTFQRDGVLAPNFKLTGTEILKLFYTIRAISVSVKVIIPIPLIPPLSGTATALRVSPRRGVVVCVPGAQSRCINRQTGGCIGGGRGGGGGGENDCGCSQGKNPGKLPRRRRRRPSPSFPPSFSEPYYPP